MKKFFDSVDQETLLNILSRRIKDNITFSLLKEIIYSYTSIAGQKIGMPIGNLTSQIFANIYLNELDRYVKHHLKPKSYLRYGDDFILVDFDLQKLALFRAKTIEFLENNLKLQVNKKSDRLIKATDGLKFLGVILWPEYSTCRYIRDRPSGRTLVKRSLDRIKNRLSLANVSSYHGLVYKHASRKDKKRFIWQILEKI